MSDRSDPVPGLEPLQRWFAAVMTHPQSVTEAIASTALESGGQSASVQALIRPSARQRPEERMAIYHRAYTARLIECLLDDYPALANALDVEFKGLCRRYIARHPSQAPSLNGFGAHMPAFCAAQRGDHAAFHAELAQLEWAVVEVIHAHDGEPISLSTLGALSPQLWAERALTASPALRLLETHYPVNAYYQAFREHLAPAVPAADLSFTVVRRRGARVVREPQTPQAGQLLQRLLSSQPIGRALEVAAAGGMTTEQVSACFEHWIGCGYFVGTEQAT